MAVIGSLCMSKSQILVVLLYARMKNQGLWTIKNSRTHSWCIRKILQSREMAKQFIRYEVGTNSEFYMWLDPWAGSPLIERLSPSIVSICESTYLARVKDFLSNSSWRPSTSNHVLAIELRHIQSTIQVRDGDKISWDGMRTIKMNSIWNNLRPIKPIPPWIEVVWHSWKIPKCAFFLWLSLKDRLLTKVKMLAFGMNIDSTCILCSRSDETINHLLVECCYSMRILRCCPFPLTCDWVSFTGGNTTVGNLSRPRKQLANLYLAVAFYNIWKERNQRVHNTRIGKNPTQLVMEIKRTVREKVFTCPSFKSAASKDQMLIHALY